MTLPATPSTAGYGAARRSQPKGTEMTLNADELKELRRYARALIAKAKGQTNDQ